MTALTDWRQLALDSGGRSLIEASAGTGKTWTISVLYLRLLLEHGLMPQQIVVTTFTDAAAQELRERIRGRLLWAEQVALAQCALIETGCVAPARADVASDELWLRQHWQQASADNPLNLHERLHADITRLRLAIAELDLAPIGTLHGLCRKILSNYPFESGSGFALGELLSGPSLHAELTNDIWRQLQQGNPPKELQLDCRTLNDLNQRLKAYAAPGVSLPPPPEAMDELTEKLSAEMAERLRRLLERKIFTTKKRTLKPALTCLADYLDSQPRDSGLLPKQLGNLLPSDLSEHIQNDALSDPEIVEVLAFARRIAEQLQAATVEETVRPWRYWLGRYKDLRQHRLSASGGITFDDLIERVHRALPPGGSALAEVLFTAWPVALVDEFQDTDAMQFAILDRIYRQPLGQEMGPSGGQHRGRLVMIGDPKQAIYRFRGGDIAAYLGARRDASSQLSLDTNYRSSRALVAALNDFYTLAGPVFSSDPDADTASTIAFAPVLPSSRTDKTPYRVDGLVVSQPLHFHCWPHCPDDADGRINAALDACANHIVALLSANHAIGNTPLQPGHIAVLLPGHSHITALRLRLRECGVPCVSSARSSVFESAWARELQLVLYAALHSRNHGAIRAALATRFFGKTYSELQASRDNAEFDVAQSSEFEHLRQLWRSRGVLAVVQQLTHAAGARLFADGDSERTLTDLRHLGELLQTASATLSGPEQLLAWFSDQREGEGDAAGDAQDEQQLRIESDAARVRLMTLHASKGLEFDIVLLPLMWANKHNSKDTTAIVFDPLSQQRRVGFDVADKARYKQEGQDERFRLLYVALTRARHACHVYVLPPNRPLQANSKNADSDPNRAPLDALTERLWATLGKDVAPVSGSSNIAWSNAGWPWPMQTYEPDSTPKATPRLVLSEPKAARFTGKYSFSSLTDPHTGPSEDSSASDELAGASASAIAPAETAASDPPHPDLLALAGVAGVELGNALHAIFEHRAIGIPMAEQHDLVRRCLLEYGVALGNLPLETVITRLAQRVQATLDTPLRLGAGSAVQLGDIPAKNLRAELEFHYVLGEVTLKQLRAACVAAGEPNLLPKSNLHELRGLMTGKIDLIFQHAQRFYVLDYKGNKLGENRLFNYAPAQLTAAMDQHHYRFQALLYVIAVDRYLRQRVGKTYRRSEHLGDAIYLFVRAVGLSADAGQWIHRFSDDLIDAVDAVLATPAKETA